MIKSSKLTRSCRKRMPRTCAFRPIEEDFCCAHSRKRAGSNKTGYRDNNVAIAIDAAKVIGEAVICHGESMPTLREGQYAPQALTNKSRIDSQDKKAIAQARRRPCPASSEGKRIKEVDCGDRFF